MNIVHHFLPSKYILTFVKKIKTCQLVIWPAWLQIPLRKWLSSGAKVKFWRPFCLCKLDRQELKIPLGNRVFRIQHTQIRLKSLVPNFYSKMPLELYRALFFRKSSRYSIQNEAELILSRIMLFHLKVNKGFQTNSFYKK